MKRIINFGYKTIEEQLDFLISYLEAGEMLLFQYYDCLSFTMNCTVSYFLRS